MRTSAQQVQRVKEETRKQAPKQETYERQNIPGKRNQAASSIGSSMTSDGMSKMVRDTINRFRILAETVSQNCWLLAIKEGVENIRTRSSELEHAMYNHDSFPFSASVVKDVAHFVEASSGVSTTSCSVKADAKLGHGHSALKDAAVRAELDPTARHALLVNLIADDMWTRGETSATRAHSEAHLCVLRLAAEVLDKVLEIVKPESDLVDAVSKFISEKGESERKDKVREMLASLTSEEKLAIVGKNHSAVTQVS
jgi:hypothetical protein